MSIATPTRPASPADITAPLETAYLRPPRVPADMLGAEPIDECPGCGCSPHPDASSSHDPCPYHYGALSSGFESHFAALDALPLVSPLPSPRALSGEYWATYERLCGGVAELVWRVSFCSGRVAREINDITLESVTIDGVELSRDLVTDEMQARAEDSLDPDAMRRAG
jgi:hypothetical protein